MSKSKSPAHPPLMPIVSKPSSLALDTTALIDAFRPGASPPPTRIPIFKLLSASAVFEVSNNDSELVEIVFLHVGLLGRRLLVILI